MKTSQRGIDFIKEFESFSPTIYQCSAGKSTIGFGHVLRAGESFLGPLTLPQANELLAKDLERFEIAVLEAVDVPLNQNEFDACVSLSFNIGGSAFANSTLVKMLNKEEARTRVADQFSRWDKVAGKPLAGLTRRRAAEREMFLWKV